MAVLDHPISPKDQAVSNSDDKAAPTWDIARLFPNQGSWRESDYLDLTDSTRWLVEFEHGRVRVLEMPTDAHQDILMYILMALANVVDTRGRGKVRPAPLRLRTRDGEFREPDIMVKLKGHQLPDEDRFWRQADLVVEIVSEGSDARNRDFIDKRESYASAGVPEYWIVDPSQSTVNVLILGADRAYGDAAVLRAGQSLTSRLLPEFSLDVAAIFAAANQD